MPAVADLSTLMARVALGDRAAFRVLYDATQAHLFGVVRRITRNDSVASEVLQDAYVAVWHRASTYDPTRSAVMTWMTTIVRNRAFDRLSLASARHETELSEQALERLVQAPDDGGDAGAWMDERAQHARLHDCMAHLAPRQRQSVALAFLHGLSHAEVAAHLGEPLGSVKAWIRRAMGHLRTCLEGVT